jgi:hypothetical protein
VCESFFISLAIAIIANVPQCMDRFIQCARALEYNSQKTGSVASSDVFEAIWIGIISASDRKEAKVCGRLCSYIGSTLFRPLRQGKCVRRGQLEEGFVRESFLHSFTKLCSIRDSLTNNSFVCRSLIYALISSCSERRTAQRKSSNDESTTNIVQGIYFCIDNMWLGDDEGSSDDSNFERNLTLFDRDKQFRDALLTAVKSTRVTPEIINWSQITGGMVPRGTSRITTHKAVAKIIDSLNSQERFVSSLQAATSEEEKSRLAFSMAHCDLTRIKSSPACKEVIDALIGAPKHYKLFANECDQTVKTYSFSKVKKVIVNAIQNLGGCHELIEHMPRSAAANEADDAPALALLSVQPYAPNAATPRPSTSSSALEASTPSSARPRCAAAARGAFAALDEKIASSEDLGGSACAEAPPPVRRRQSCAKNVEAFLVFHLCSAFQN